MTGVQRCLAAMQGKTTDRPAVFGGISHPDLVRHITGQPITPENARSLLIQTHVACVDATRQLLADGLFVMYRDDEQVRDEEGYTWRRRPFNQWLEVKPWNDTDGMAVVLRRQIERMDAWRAPRPDQDEHLRQYRLLDERVEGQILLMGCAYVGTSPGSFNRDGMEDWTYLSADHPDVAKAWIAARHRMNLRRIQAYADPHRCPVEHMDSDIAGKNGLYVSPQFLRESGWFDRISELADAYHRQGVKVVFHSDGNLQCILGDLAATGIDGVNPIDGSAGMTLAATRRTVGPNMLLVGGLDHGTLRQADPGQVNRYVREQMACMAGSPWWAGSSSEEWDETIPLANVLAILDALGVAEGVS